MPLLRGEKRILLVWHPSLLYPMGLMKSAYRRAHSHRIVGSAVYDGLILLGLIMVAAALALPVNYVITGDAANGSHPLFRLYLVTVVALYFGYFWKKSGQTVGMKAWGIKLVNLREAPLTWRQLAMRLLVAIPAYLLAGIGIVWQYIDHHGLNWQDRASETRLVRLPNKKR